MPSDVVERLEAKEWKDVEQDSTMRWNPSWRTALKSGLRSLLLWNNPSNGQSDRLRPTAYLDGLRGFAAFIVYWHHHQLWVHRSHWETLESGFGHKDENYFVTFPGIRNFVIGGHYAVSIFYVISGYVLSAKPLSLIHAGEQAKLADNLSSATFRRWIRLYMPLIATTFIIMSLWHSFGGIWVDGAEPKSSYGEELWAWYAEVKNYSFIFNTGGGPWLSYNHHLWSIPLEFKGSIVIYTSLLALSTCSRNARILAQVGLAYYFLYVVDGYYCALFMAGMLLCDLDLLAAKDELPLLLSRLQTFKKPIAYHLLAISFFLGGVPTHKDDINLLRKNRGWYYLSFLKPQAVYNYQWFYLFWAAVFLVGMVRHVPWLKRFFETRFCQYLGRISYALYLVHGPVLSILGDRLYTAVGWYTDTQAEHLSGWVDKFPLPKTGPLGLEVSFLIPHLIILPVTIYCAELVTRGIDEPSVKFPQWLYRITTGRPVKLPA
ncbi:acyltransferase family-domain-containing protein [Podospora didyma]|uniref:Acyltransferase family-domain-containing protein n=1 Tax=Podospora didyma TaxID=330526 RepID=A0AAE0N2P2_9PEZI|nr:acyltransferase family-domain-containing protein [Podospora didyma]